jgi:hypothetical protein
MKNGNRAAENNSRLPERQEPNMPRSFKMAALLGAFASLCLMGITGRALAWGDEGHQVVALVADHFLDPVVKRKIDAMLAADTDPLTAHDIPGAAIWAAHDNRIRLWHVVDLELDHPDLNAACFGHPGLPAGVAASDGPEKDCVVDKIEQFAAELASPRTKPSERLIALKFLLELVGDVHQPLDASDNHNGNGTGVLVTASAFSGRTLADFWNNETIEELGDDPKEIASDLVGGIQQNHAFAAMSKGAPSDWAMETFGVAKDHAYGRLPSAGADGRYALDAEYETGAIQASRVQLARAGARLAALLNRALTD